MQKDVFHKRNNKGATMVVCIMIMAVLIIFTFAVTLAAYTLYASQNKNIASMRCSEAANSLSAALDEELQDPDAAQKSHLYQYLRFNLCQSDESYWPYYSGGANHTREYACRYFDLNYNENKVTGWMEGFPGSIKLCIYWELPPLEDGSGTKTFSDISSDKNNVRLHIEITCEAANQSYTVENIYRLEETNYPDDEYEKKYLIALNKDDEDNTLRNAVNPMGFTDDYYDWNKKWTWFRVYE